MTSSVHTTTFGAQASVLVSLLVASSFLSACGQKGPLFLPDKQTAEVPAPAPQPPGTEPTSEQTSKKKAEPR
jgi:predicted small lipoprotein YifL